MTLTDDEVDAELHVLAQKPRLPGPGGWDRAIARHFYALGLAAIPREPTQDAPERMPAVLSYEYQHEDGRRMFVGVRIVADGWEADNPCWRRVGARYAPLVNDGRYCATKHLPTLCSDCPARWCDGGQGENP